MEYKDALYFMTHNGATSSQETVSYQMMIEAMERQIPRKPLNRATGKWQVPEGECAECSTSVFWRDWYCPRCGQRIDWGDGR